MAPDSLFISLAVFALVWALGATFALLRPRRGGGRRPLLYAALSLAALVAVIWLNATISLGRNAVVYLFEELLDGSLVNLVAAGLGFCLGLGPALWPFQAEWTRPAHTWLERLRRSAGLAAILGCFACLAVLALQEQLKPYLVNRDLANILASPGTHDCDPNFTLERVHECKFHPVQIAVGPDGNLFAVGYTGDALQRGVAAELTMDANRVLSEKVIARHLNRPHGLAFHDGDLYVSRSGQYARAVNGVLRGVNTGAVTRLRDIDGDGLMDSYEDVITELPGAQGPDPLHQNNGIAFGPDGRLFVTVGAHSDRGPISGPLEGTIICSRLDGSEPFVFANGLRNPFDLAIGPGGNLFCTDNDPSEGGTGDELNLLVEGGHYGFPYANGSQEHPAGSVPPLWVHRHGSLQGLAYAASPELPEKYRNCLYVISYGSGEIWRVALEPAQDAYRARAELFARIPNALDITVTDEGVFYVSCFRSKEIYRLAPK